MKKSGWVVIAAFVAASIAVKADGCGYAAASLIRVNYDSYCIGHVPCGDFASGCAAGIPMRFDAMYLYPSFTHREYTACEPVEWDWGDGTPPLQTTAIVFHTFQRPGPYVVRARSVGSPFAAIQSIRITESLFNIDPQAFAIEGAQSTSVVVLRDRADFDATIDYRTSGGFPGVDYQPVNGTLSFAAGETSKTINVPLLRQDDNVLTGDSSFSIELSNPSGGHGIAGGKQTITIVDNEQNRFVIPPTIRLYGKDPIDVSVERLGNTWGSCHFDFMPLLSQSGYCTGVPPFDYSPNFWSHLDLYFAPGELKKLIHFKPTPKTPGTSQTAVQIHASCETAPGRNENFQINSTTVFVTDDSPGPLWINDLTVTEGNSGSPFAATFTIGRAGFATSSTTVTWSTADGTAKAGEDYIASSGTITFASGETQKTIQVLILPDRQYEDDETFRVVLASSGTIEKGTATATILNDDTVLSPDPLNVAVGATEALTLLLPRAADGKDTIAINSSNPAHASVQSSMTPPAGTTNVTIPVKGENAGTARVTVSAPSFNAAADVFVWMSLQLSVSPHPLALQQGSFGTLTLTATPPPGVAIAAAVTVDDPSIVRAPSTIVIPPDGVTSFDVEALAAGSSRIMFTLSQFYCNASAAARVEVSERILPAITSIEPVTGPMAGGTAVTIAGTALDQGCMASFDGIAASTTFTNGTLVATTPAHPPGAVDVTVNCASGTATLPGGFTYVVTRGRSVRH